MTRKSDKSIFYRTIPSHKQMMAFITLVTRRSPDILLSFYQIIVFLNLVREKKKKKIVFYILQICMSRKLLEDPIFTFYFTFISFIVFFVLFFFRSD
jgi:hypothetical protein